MENKDYQKAFRERMYAQGFTQKVIWVKRDDAPKGKSQMGRQDFIREMDFLTVSLSAKERSKIYKKTLALTVELAAPKSKTR